MSKILNCLEVIMNTHTRLWMLAVLITTNVFTARAQHPTIASTDHLFPDGGKSMVTVATGIPYVGISEYSYGFSDRFTAGVIVGTTPMVMGYGVRVRVIILERAEEFRVHIRVPILYYPKSKALGVEWALTRPTLMGEWTLASGTRLSAGGGIVAASCLDFLLGLEKEGEGFMGGVWNTLIGGIAIPLSSRMAFQGEVSAVMSGVKLAGKDWVGGPPVILVIGFSYSL